MNSERPYDIEPAEEFEETINKLGKKDNATHQRVTRKLPKAILLQRIKSEKRVILYPTVKKMLQIARDPHLGKPLSNVLKGRRRAHVGHFVITYRINEEKHRVVFLKFAHHDEAYK